MANKIPVKYYENSMPGMPQITNQYGQMVAALDYVLVNGSAPVAVISATFVGGKIRIETAVPNAYAVHQTIELMGADQPEYVGEFMVTGFASPTVVEVEPGATAPSVPTATGTMTVRVPPMGYEIAFTGTNRRVYRSLNTTGRRPYIRVDNDLPAGWGANYSINARVTAAAGMSGIDTFTDGRAPYNPAFPARNDTVEGTGTSAIYGWFTWKQATSTNGAPDSNPVTPFTQNRSWYIVGDDRAFYFVHDPYVNLNGGGFITNGFGEFESFKPNDPYNYFLLGYDYRAPASAGTFPGYGSEWVVNQSTKGMILGKNFTGYGHHTAFYCSATIFAGPINSTSGLSDQVPWPNGPDSSLWVSPRYIMEHPRGDIRGIMPGAYHVNHYIAAVMPNGTIVDNVFINGTSEKKKMILLSGATNASNGRVAFDLTGPWR